MLVRRSCGAVSLVLLLATTGYAKESSNVLDEGWPRRVLITNDDGIDSRPTLELARAFSQSAETFLVAPIQNQSSGTNFATAARTSRFEVEPRDVGPGITAWAVEGFPADCVFFALAGPLRDDPPDLVVSGVNTGSNLADAWILSGTIGAVRVAAYYGIHGIAVSGIDEDDPEAVERVAAWVVRFAQSEAVRLTQPPQFLTVSLPVGPTSGIQGVEVVERARGLRDMRSQLLSEDADGNGRQIWSFDVIRDALPAPDNTDAAIVAGGAIAIVAMRVDESDPELHRWLKRNKDLIPTW